MIEKGRSNNKSLYLLLALVLAILAGTAYGVYALFLTDSPAPQPVANVSTTAKPQASKADNKNAQTNEAPENKQNSTADPGKVKPAADSTQTSNAGATAHSSNTKEQAPAQAAADIVRQYSILIKKADFKLYVLDKGQVIESFDCALGKNPGDKQKSGDMKTPNGTFKVIEVCDASYWTHDFKDGKGEIKGAYGPWFFYLDTTAKSKGLWDGIGIHGTHDPSSMRTLASEGCIRLLNKNVQLLKDKYIRVGTMVTIEE